MRSITARIRPMQPPQSADRGGCLFYAFFTFIRVIIHIISFIFAPVNTMHFIPCVDLLIFLCYPIENNRRRKER